MEEKILDGMMDEMFAQDAGSTVDTVTQPPSEPPKDAPPAKDSPPQEPEGKSRQADGRFAPKEPAAPEATAPAQPPASKPLIHAEEFKGYLDERDKRQQSERERDEIKRERDELRRQLQAQQQPANIPSIQDDPGGYAEHIRQEMALVATDTRFEISEFMATEKHGAAVVKAAMDWGLKRAKESPGFHHEYLRHRNPIAWVVQQHERDERDGGEAFKAWVAKKHAELHPNATLSPQSSPAAPQQPAAPAQAQPRPSIVDAPTAGGMTSQPTGWDAPFDALFRRTG